MTPDGLPIYRRSPARPNAFACVCHSGVTLAAAHTQELARQIVAGSLSGLAASFDSARFDVQAA
jgi:glycine/D-amino acid oxidase-like deaminating enzyme